MLEPPLEGDSENGWKVGRERNTCCSRAYMLQLFICIKYAVVGTLLKDHVTSSLNKGLAAETLLVSSYVIWEVGREPLPACSGARAGVSANSSVERLNGATYTKGLPLLSTA